MAVPLENPEGSKAASILVYNSRILVVYKNNWVIQQLGDPMWNQKFPSIIQEYIQCQMESNIQATETQNKSSHRISFPFQLLRNFFILQTIEKKL